MVQTTPAGWPAVFNFGNTLINLRKSTAAPGLIEPATVAQRDAGSRPQLTIDVDDVDAMCAVLAERGVTLLNGPVHGPILGRPRKRTPGIVGAP